MSFEKLINKVTQAENTLEANERKVGADLRQLKDSWKEMWSPGRIIVVGLASGFLVGRAEPLRTVARSGGLLRMTSTLMSVFSGATAAAAASDVDEAGDAAESAHLAGVASEANTQRTATFAASADSTRRQGRQLHQEADESVAHDYLERLAAAARQAGGNG